MYSFLPDELLKEILAPALRVPDDSFACTSGRSPFSNYNQTTSAYLLVCKDWLRVATPLLYSVVVLRSKAQIQALESTIKSNRVLANFIRKLRIESSYCTSLLAILKSAKNLTDLCLSLEVYSSDNVAAICRGFAFINPTRLIIYDLWQHKPRDLNRKAQQLLKSTHEYVGKWDKLKTVSLPAWSDWSTLGVTRLEEFAAAISKSQSIEVVYLSGPHGYPGWLDRLSKTPNLKKIIIRFTMFSFSASLSNTVRSNPRLRQLVHWDLDEADGNPSNIRNLFERSPSPNPTIQKDWLAAFPDSVWTNILFYAMGLPELEQCEFSELPRTVECCYMPENRQSLALVCKKLHKLAMPLYWRCIIIRWDRDLRRVASLVSRKKEIGRQIKTLFITTVPQNLIEFLLHTPNIQRLSAKPNPGCSPGIFNWKTLSTLAQKAGPRLVDLVIHLHRPTQPKTPDVFYRFTALKHLDFTSCAKFTFEPAKVKKKALRNLESITYTSINNTFLSLLSCMELPKIRRARFPMLGKCEGAITFLRKHGHKLLSLELGFLPGISVFDTCPNLEEFTVPAEKPGFAVPEFFSSSDEHPLKILYINTNDVARGAERERFKYIGGLDLSNFTSLRQIKVSKCCWPTTENELKKSHWAVWAERLQEVYRVDIVDGRGQKWVPRLRGRKKHK